MNTKLTLTIDQAVIERAKKYARDKGHSLSDMIENYLKAVTKDEVNPGNEMTPLVKSLKGSFKAPAGFEYRKELARSLTKKYMHE
jgi:hypothetical protein